ncbi:MAG: proton-conducting transporter membrane subunit [Syntrophobacteraceae bacterium]|nr:proton-conducting transporter membrane subunit [Syntrophobacteraceae bacterium]
MEYTVSNLMTTPLLLFLLIVSPFLAALCVYRARSLFLQSLVVTATGAVLAAGALLLVPRAPFGLSLAPLSGSCLHGAANGADFLLLCVILYFGFKYRHPVIEALSVMQIIVLVVLEVFGSHGKHPADLFYGDNLALMLVMIASIAIAVSTLRLSFIPCLQDLEDHPELKQSGRGRFFALLLICLGAFNGVLLSNDMSFFYFFFESITLCSFLLIAQKGTPAAEKKAVRTLSMTSLAGLVLLLAMT